MLSKGMVSLHQYCGNSVEPSGHHRIISGHEETPLSAIKLCQMGVQEVRPWTMPSTRNVVVRSVVQLEVRT